MIESDTKDGKVLLLELQTGSVGRLPDDRRETEEETKIPKKVKPVLVIIGVSSFLPWNMALTAAGYYMVRLAGTRFEHTFPYFIQATVRYCNLLGSLANLYLIKRLDTRASLLITSLIMGTSPIVMTVLAKIDTSTWPETFFILNLASLALFAVSHGINMGCQGAICNLISPEIVKDYWIGKALVGLVASIVTIVTLSFPTLDVETAAFYYFLVGTTATLVGNAGLNYYLLGLDILKDRTKANNQTEESQPKAVVDGETLPVWKLMKLIQIPFTTIILSSFTSYVIFPGVLTNLKPINNENPTIWNEKYFIKVLVFLTFNVGDVFGRTLSRFTSWPGMKGILYISLVRLLLIPLIFMTNIQPRALPVWFKSDVVPAVLTFVTASSGSYLANLCLAFAPMCVTGEGEKRRASVYIVFGVSMGVAVASGCIFVVPAILNLDLN